MRFLEKKKDIAEKKKDLKTKKKCEKSLIKLEKNLQKTYDKEQKIQEKTGGKAIVSYITFENQKCVNALVRAYKPSTLYRMFMQCCCMGDKIKYR